MSMIRWKPFEELDKFFEDMPNLRTNTWDLAADIYEDNGNVIVEMHVPAINPDKIDIEVEDTHLRIAGSREDRQEVEDQQYYHREIKAGSFERRLHLPCPVIREQVRASFKDGVLKIVLPKEGAKEAQKVKVTRE
jgi:HSP20 family protein